MQYQIIGYRRFKTPLKQRITITTIFRGCTTKLWHQLKLVANDFGLLERKLQLVIINKSRRLKNQFAFNRTERQQFLNKFPQYTVSVQGLKIHYIHVKPKVNKQADVKVVPLLLLHGWPGSVREFYELIPLLTEPQNGTNYAWVMIERGYLINFLGRKVVFEVIAPSLPGYGFSQATNKPGLSAIRIAQIMKNLMLRLGFKQFYVQVGVVIVKVVKLVSNE